MDTRWDSQSLGHPLWLPSRHAAALDSRPLIKQRIHELVRIEQLQVVDLLADADVFHRDAHLLADRDDDAPLGGAVELGEDDAGAAGRFGKMLRLADAVLAGRGVEHQQAFVRRAGDLLARSRGGSLSSSFIRFCCVCNRPAVSIDHDVDAGFDAFIAAGERDAGRVGAARLRDDLAAEPLAPQRQLFDGRRAKRVAGGEHDRLAVRLSRNLASLAIDVVLPAPLTPATRITVGSSAANLSGERG